MLAERFDEAVIVRDLGFYKLQERKSPISGAIRVQETYTAAIF
jgi:hypothetical protein